MTTKFKQIINQNRTDVSSVQDLETFRINTSRLFRVGEFEYAV